MAECSPQAALRDRELRPAPHCAEQVPPGGDPCGSGVGDPVVLGVHCRAAPCVCDHRRAPATIQEIWCLMDFFQLNNSARVISQQQTFALRCCSAS